MLDDSDDNLFDSPHEVKQQKQRKLKPKRRRIDSDSDDDSAYIVPQAQVVQPASRGLVKGEPGSVDTSDSEVEVLGSSFLSSSSSSSSDSLTKLNRFAYKPKNTIDLTAPSPEQEELRRQGEMKRALTSFINVDKSGAIIKKKKIGKNTLMAGKKGNSTGKSGSMDSGWLTRGASDPDGDYGRGGLSSLSKKKQQQQQRHRQQQLQKQLQKKPQNGKLKKPKAGKGKKKTKSRSFTSEDEMSDLDSDDDEEEEDEVELGEDTEESANTETTEEEDDEDEDEDDNANEQALKAAIKASKAECINVSSDEEEEEEEEEEEDAEQAKLAKESLAKLEQCRVLSERLRVALMAWERQTLVKNSAGRLGDSRSSGQALAHTLSSRANGIEETGSDGVAGIGSSDSALDLGCLNLVAMPHAPSSAQGADANSVDDNSADDDDDDEYSGGRRTAASFSSPSGASKNGSAGKSFSGIEERDVERLCSTLKLKAYQCVGVNWLLLLHHEGLNGVLADDMGLGKTVQTISFFVMLRHQAETRRRMSVSSSPRSRSPNERKSSTRLPMHLVVVPSSVLTNWQSELSRFAPHLTVVAYHGTQTARFDAQDAINRSSKANPGGDLDRHVDVVVTTYTYFERESGKEDRRFLRSQPWAYMVLDEAHGVKNMKTSRWNNLKMLKSERKLLLSGTPVQNNLRELLVLLDFLSPEVFNFRRELRSGFSHEDDGVDPIGDFLVGLGLNPDGTHDEPKEPAGGAGSDPQSSSDKVPGASDGRGAISRMDRVRQIRVALAPFVLRRLKSQVLSQLAPKTTREEQLPTTVTQRRIYDGILRRHVERQRSRMSGKNGRKGGKVGSAASRRQASSASVTVDLSSDQNVDDDEKDPELQAALAASRAEAEQRARAAGDAIVDVVEEKQKEAKPSNALDLLMASQSNTKNTMAAEDGNKGCGGNDIYDENSALPVQLENTARKKETRASAPVDDKELSALVGNDRDAKNVFVELRKAANHPLLLRSHFDDDEKLKRIIKLCLRRSWFGEGATEEMVRKELLSYCDLDMHQLVVDLNSPKLKDLELPEESIFESCKMNYLRTLVPRLITENHRILIFSQWTKLLDILEMLMDHLNVGWMRMDGQTAVAERQEMIDEFNSNESNSVFLLSTRAGGMGINLTSADTVILHDLDFNPVSDRQAEDRCHRIGQTRPVTVYKLVTANTVDAKILEMGKRKNEVNTMLMGDGGGASSTEPEDENMSVSGMLKDALRLFIDDAGSR